MRVVSWNSQGAKWGRFWRYYMNPNPPAQPNPSGETTIGLLVEAGWAPWIKSGSVPVNTVFPLDETSTRYQRPDPNDQKDPDATAMVDAITGSRRRRAFWIPWAASPGSYRTDSRCSIGALLAPGSDLLQGVSRIRVPWFKRPVLRLQLGPGKDVALTVLLVHMISGRPWSAEEEMTYLTSSMRALIPEGTAGLVVGDMNLDLQTTAWTPPSRWRLLRLGRSTHGTANTTPSELDYGLLWDPTGTWSASCQELERYSSGNNPSDHSVMAYPVTRSR